MITNKQNLGFLLQVWVEKSVHGMETHRLSGKEKVPGVAESKQCDTYRLQG